MALCVVLVTALWLLTHATIERTSSAAIERAVDVDLAGLVDIYASGGEDELVRRITDRLALVPSEGNAAHYVLARENGRRIAGDLAEWPALNARLSESGHVRLPGGVGAHGRATQLGPDLRLAVLRDQGDTAMLQWRVGLVFLGAGAALLIAVGLLGRLATQGLSRRIGRRLRRDVREFLIAVSHLDARDQQLAVLRPETIERAFVRLERLLTDGVLQR